MADISIPSQLEFKELLSHTFPGFFSAITLFMLIDILSPIDITSWAIGSLTGLVSFVGFLIIIGTILGVIIDSIHHTFIEDDIFDNFTEIKNIKAPLISRLRTICDNKNLNIHYFSIRLGSMAIKP